MKATLDDSSIGQPDEATRLFVLATLGDANAANELYSRCVPSLRAWLAARVGNAMAEDVAHDALVMAFQKSGTFRAGAAFGPWLRTLAWNLALKSIRSEKRRRSRETEYLNTMRLNATPIPGSDERRQKALNACIASLPTRQFQLIRSRYFEEKTSDEIATEQGRKRVAVAVNLHRICKGLRKEIEKIMQSPDPTKDPLFQSQHLG